MRQKMPHACNNIVAFSGMIASGAIIFKKFGFGRFVLPDDRACRRLCDDFFGLRHRWR